MAIIFLSLFLTIVPMGVLLYFFSTEGFSLGGPAGRYNASEFTIPKINEYAYASFDPKPRSDHGIAAYDLDFYASQMKLYDEGIGGVYLVAGNRGNTTLFIYSYGLVPESGQYDAALMHKTGGYLYTWADDAYLGGIILNVSGLAGIARYRACAGIAVRSQGDDIDGYESGNTTWTDIGVVCPKTLNVTIPDNSVEYKKIKVEKAGGLLASRINQYITPVDPNVRSVVGRIAEDHSGEYNLDQVCALYDWIGENINYVSDPRGRDYWLMPSETLDSGVGDCEDQVFLLSSLIESVGGTTKIFMLDDHAFTAFYSGDNESTARIKKEMMKKYGTAYIASLSDEYGNWIVLDPTCGFFPGDLPCNAISTGGLVFFANQTLMTETYVNA